MHDTSPHKAFLLDLLDAALAAVRAPHCLPPALPEAPPAGRTLVLGAGKAAAAMAHTAVQNLAGPLHGLVVTRHGHGGGLETGPVAVREAGHPVPDAASMEAAQAMLDLARACTPQDRLIFLASGGGSATLALPLPGLTLRQKQDIVRALVRSGAAIGQINCLRKHVSAIKGGRLAAASGTRDIHTFIISDVAGDAAADVASGPTLADAGTLADARAIMEAYSLPHAQALKAVLASDRAETPKPGTVPGRYSIIARAADALAAARRLATARGWQVHDLGDCLEGEASALGRAHGALALRLRAQGGRHLVLSGGEAVVSLPGASGAGGPNQEYLAALAQALHGAPGIYALACDTDGIDGAGDAAGAFLAPDTLKRARACGVTVDEALRHHDSGALFAAAGDLVKTGPTLTNVNDFRAIAIDGTADGLAQGRRGALERVKGIEPSS